jgi:hypothetical protein
MAVLPEPPLGDTTTISFDSELAGTGPSALTTTPMLRRVVETSTNSSGGMSWLIVTVGVLAFITAPPGTCWRA